MIAFEPRGDLAVVRLDRPEKKNALTPKMLRGLASHVETTLSAKAIVLSGVGDVFCAGFDLGLARDDDGALGSLLEALAAATRALREAPCPVVVSAHGAAIAGGGALLSAADFAVTTPGAKIGYPAVALGISPAVSGPHLAATAGHGPARARLLDPGLIDGRGALRIGMACELAPDAAECEAKALALAEMLAAKPRHALGYTKRWLNELDGSTHAPSLRDALDASVACVGTSEQRDRLAALWARGG
ncbi:MAG: hypothetical protein HBSAPP03_09170 [Phycisphaerae bacterium]|nr:MAG: hypothetical protein HBSAPP03_09170 [Phycisphaerae bacterium]